MKALPDLSQLSEKEKDALIVHLWELVQRLESRVKELEGRLKLNSKNSSKPPSSDGWNKPAPKSLREKGKRKSGGQEGHEGKTLMAVEKPDRVEVHEVPKRCEACEAELPQGEVKESRQVFDLPELKYEVTEHVVMRAVCGCGREHVGVFPPEVRSAVQYGPRAKAAMVHLTQNHMVSVNRTAGLMGELFGLEVSEATVLAAVQEAAQELQETVQSIGEALVQEPVAHADETGIRVQGKLHWIHALVSERLTLLEGHAKRGTEAFEELGWLRQFKGVLVHDGLAAYRTLTCEHALCNAHHQRELVYLIEQYGQTWALKMEHLFKDAKKLYDDHRLSGTPPDPQSIQTLRERYDRIIQQGLIEHPVDTTPNWSSGRRKQSKATNLLLRLRDHAQAVWRFLTHPSVPFTNNLAEQAVRMSKIKQKVSGGFRTPIGLTHYCRIRSYCATLTKQRIPLFEALVQTFLLRPTQPSFS